MRKALNNLVAFLLVVAGLTLSGCSLVNFDKRSGDYTISGKIVDKEGNAIGGVKISVAGSSSISTETNSQGLYTLEDVCGSTIALVAKKSGFVFIPTYKAAGDYVSGSYINVGAVASKGIVSNADFCAVREDELTISDVQGSASKSTLEGVDVTVTGVVTMVTNKAPNFNYNDKNIYGEDTPQYTGTDGFFLEALPEDRDFSGKKSNGIYISTHDDSFSDSKWKEGIPTDLQAGDVVTVKGSVLEQRVMDHYGSCDDSLTRTVIDATFVSRVYEGSTPKTAAYPDGVLLTYDESKGQTWADATYTVDGVEYKKEYRVLPYDSNSNTPMVEAINVFESVESMVIRIDNPVVCGSTYYNTTSVLADDAKGPDGNYFRTYNTKWKGNVIQENPVTHNHDYNEELIMIDYQAIDWALNYPLVQLGDKIVDTKGDPVFRGVMDYQPFGNSFMYFARPLNNKASGYILSGSYSGAGYLTPYYTRTDSAKITSVSGAEIPNQGFNFDVTNSWYSEYLSSSNSSLITAMSGNGDSTKKLSSSSAVKSFRIGTYSNASFDANSIFTPAWVGESDPTSGNTVDNTLTMATYNLENYEANNKKTEVALIIKNNLLYPDVLVLVEMGDDVKTDVVYANLSNQYSFSDGHITAVRNLSGISDQIVANGGPRYDFRCIDPKEGDSGGKSGVNIRLAIMYNTERIEAVDTGLVTNTYYNTHGNSYDGALLDISEWPVQTENEHIQGWTLAEASGSIYRGDDGKAHLTQSPTYVQDTCFEKNRRPLLVEFKRKGTDDNFFVMACHLGAKSGDHSLYGEVQPPILLSEIKRNNHAKVVNSVTQEILDADSDAKIIVAGDMNDFAFSTPQRILTGQRSNNQILYSPVEEFMPITEQFSYYFEGNLQQIDHIFLSKSLFEKTQSAVQSNDLSLPAGEEWGNACFIAHINSTVNRLNKFNNSDHDPDMVRIPDAFGGAGQ